jgi:hypothetical protein
MAAGRAAPARPAVPASPAGLMVGQGHDLEAGNQISRVASEGLNRAIGATNDRYWTGERHDLMVGAAKTSLGNFLTFNLQLRGTALATETAHLEPGLRAIIQAVAWTFNNIPAFAVNQAVGRDHIPVKIRGENRDLVRHILTEVVAPVIPAACGAIHDIIVAAANHNIPGNVYGDPKSLSSFFIREGTRAILVNGLSAAGAGTLRENCRATNALGAESRGENNRNVPYSNPNSESTLDHVLGYIKAVSTGLLTTNMLQSHAYAAVGSLAYAGLQYLAFSKYNPAEFTNPDDKYNAAVAQAGVILGAICIGWGLQHTVRIVAGQRVFDNPAPPIIRETNAG